MKINFIKLRWLAVWKRNLQVWYKLAGPSFLANFVDPLLIWLALGYGLGTVVGTVQGVPYIIFLTAGMVCSSTMNTATFESLYSAYTRMATQQTWQGMLATPLGVTDIVLGEIIWAATKSLVNVTVLLIVAAGLGLVPSWQAVWVLPVMFTVGLCFSAMAMIITTLAYSYDFFLYYMTLFITPLTVLSGIYFPLENLHSWMQPIVWWFPLAHAVNLTRLLITGQPVTLAAVLIHLGIVISYALVAMVIAIKFAKRRLHS